MTEDHKKILQTQLWNIANTLRGKMGADEFRDYILGFIFYKYLSERMHLFADEILKHDGIRFDQIDDTTKQGQEMLAAIKEEAIERLGYFLKPTELFHKVAEKGAQKTDNFILEDLTAVLKHIEASTMGHASEDDFEGLFEDLDLGSSKLGKTENQKNELIAKVLSHLDKIDFRLADTEADVLGDAYEYLIGQFASGAGKKAGEFYTPQEVSTILAKIVTTGKKKLKSVYDPTCGSASLLLRVAKEVKDVGHFYGQEMNPTTYNLARMNMILHGVHYQRFDLKNEDTLEHPAPEHADLRFDAIVANPPFSANWSASAIHENDDRFSAYGKLAPKTKADFAFVQHMVHHLDNGATMACVLPHGVLFRGAAEGHIRKYLIDDCNYLDAVIGLPPNIFFGTGIPTCILVLKKQRENPDDILFIDASQGFEKVGNQNYLRPEHVERIVSTYRKRESIEKFSQVAELSEVEENSFNLNIPRYVDTFEVEDSVDLEEVAGKLAELEKKMGDTDKVIAGFCAELGVKAPF
ncbi:type I restriction-modification system subunit M [Akkermansiaceae bacterium]|nr:type I restriction-modification system subunit M [Akkermansiaceae bacterium]